MEFEFDPDKSARNQDKHGIDFAQAQSLWDDARLLIVEARTSDEPRFMAVGRLAGRHWSAIFTFRSNRLRLISVRRSRIEEIDRYEGP